MGAEDRSALHGLEDQLFKLVSRKATSAQWAEWLRAPLEHALAGGDEDLALSLLKAGANGGAGWKGCGGRTLLDAAAEGGSEIILSALLDAGARADVDVLSGAKRMTALHRACKSGHTAAVQVLLVEGANVGLVDSNKRSALHHALQRGHEELARHVIAAGADFKATDFNGDTPLHLAAAHGLTKFVGMLLRRGARANVGNTKKQRPLHAAVENGHIAVVDALLKEGANPNRRYDGAGIEKQCSPLYLARNNVAMTKMLLEKGADVKKKDAIGFTALHWAAYSGTPSVIDAIVAAGADLESRSSRVGLRYSYYGMTPLHVASYRHNLNTMAALLHGGANVHAQDDDGLTPLHVVCETSFEFPTRAHKAADILLRRGADETITDKYGHTPKHLIKRSGAAESLQRLLANAPADRTWRRRGMLVLCRAHPARVLGGVGDVRAAKVLCRGKGAGGGAAAGVGGGDEGGCILRRVVGLEAEEVFRTIVGFL